MVLDSWKITNMNNSRVRVGLQVWAFFLRLYHIFNFSLGGAQHRLKRAV